jgi:hypothetical protein
MIINDDKSIQIKSEIKLGTAKESINLDLKGHLDLQNRTKIQFVKVHYQGDEESQTLAKALIDHVNLLLDLDKFALDGTLLRVDRVTIRKKNLVFYGTADIDHFPNRS